MHLTFFVLVPLFALAGAQPGGPGELGAIAWLVVIFGCVVVHELAHCLVGRPRGLVVHEIELLPIGGISKLENLPEHPNDELAMAIAGPLASLAIAAAAAAVAMLVAAPLLPVDLFGGSFLARLVWFNLLIAAFNLLPAFPLDGGRVLRAYLEERGATLEGATRLAARAGRTVAVVLVVVGLFWDLWLSIIGAFVYFGASAEEAGTIMHVRLRNLVVADVMLIEPLVVGPETEAAWLYDANRHRPQRAFPVVGPNGYEGVVEASSVVGRDPATPVAELEHRTGPTLAPSDAVEGALSAIVNAPGRAVAVVDDGQVVGMVRLEEIEHLLAETPGIGPHPQA